ncbi:hypothetical protein [Haloarcula amylovorans]|uniref:hypothetical protein n=1 Tax=Haloarcula amylovorans TaxID=2562280 RepID=UPI001FD77D19|nr:hypothetical protein [Halomicroarcula amylolytica]
MGDSVTRGVLEASNMDRVLEIFAKRQRRLILFALQGGATKHKSDFVFRGADNGDDPELQLIHTHLPKLAEAGYIEWNRETDEVSKGPRYDEIEPLLNLLETHADELPPNWP